MARGKTLIALLNDLRAETKVSLNPSHNVQARESQLILLQRTQEWLWEDFDWPHLRVERFYEAEAGLRRYDFGSDFDIDRIEKIEFKTDGAWRRLEPGIDAGHYAAYDSDLDQRAYPVRRWKIYEGEQIEIWPISDQNGDPDTFEGNFKVTGIRRLNTFVADTDRADLDDRLLVLFAAFEYLAGRGDKDAAAKREIALKRYARLRGNLMPRRRFRMFGIGGSTMPRRPYIGAYRPPDEVS